MNRIYQKKMSRAIAALFAALTLLTLLASCSGDNGTGYKTLDDASAQSMISDIMQQFMESANSIGGMTPDDTDLPRNYAADVASSLLSTAEVSVQKIDGEKIIYRVISPDMMDVMERAVQALEARNGDEYTVAMLEDQVYQMVSKKDYKTAEHIVSVVAARENGMYTLNPTAELADALLGGLVEYYKSIANEGGAKQ